MKEQQERKAVFWCSLLAPVIYDEVGTGQVHAFLKQLSSTEALFPDGQQKKPSLSTLKRKLKKYRQKGFSALARKQRSDKGAPRAVSREIINKAIELKKDQPGRSSRTINQFLSHYYGRTVARATLYRHLKQNDATRLKLGVMGSKVRCRWSRDRPNQLWIGDFSYGPYVFHEGTAQRAYLCLFIDCHSRYVVEGRYYLNQSLTVLIDSLIRAWSIHGIPLELYLDNAKVYHSHAMKAACFDLTIKLIHRTVRDPEGGGLVEKLFGTAQSQFETEVRAGDILSLDRLNKAFMAWLELSYHEETHSEIKQSPRKRFTEGLNAGRRVSIERLVKFFMKKETRIVHRDFSDISLNGRFYKADPKLRGDRVIVSYDPFTEPDRLLIYSLDEQFLGCAELHNREKTQDAHQPGPPVQPKPKHNYIELLLTEHEKKLTAQARGFDYVKLLDKKRWPFGTFVQTLAGLMGLKGGATCFSTDDFEALKKLYDRYPDLNELKLVEAFEAAELKTIGHVALSLQKLKP